MFSTIFDVHRVFKVPLDIQRGDSNCISQYTAGFDAGYSDSTQQKPICNLEQQTNAYRRGYVDGYYCTKE